MSGGDGKPVWPLDDEEERKSVPGSVQDLSDDRLAGASQEQEPEPETAPDWLFRHGFFATLRQAARRQVPDADLDPETLARLVSATVALRETPARALPDPDLRYWFETALSDDIAEVRPGSDPLRATAGNREAQRRAARRTGLFALLRYYERANPDKPRIGRNLRLRDRVVALGQDPLMITLAGDIARFDPGASPPMIRAQFLGYFGAFGALPLNWSEDVAHWFEQGDEAFVAFADILTARFQELFFRAWSDAQAITQFDHPGDRFQSWLLSGTGNGTEAMQGRDALSDTIRAGFAALASGHVRSPVRLRQMLARLFAGKARIEIEEMVPAWLDFETGACNRVGGQNATMGQDLFLGGRMRSLSERIRLHVSVDSIARYFDFLPGRRDHALLRALVHWYLGQAHEVELVLWLPRSQISHAKLGEATQLGWMACIAPPRDQAGGLVEVTSFVLEPPGPQDFADSITDDNYDRAA